MIRAAVSLIGIILLTGCSLEPKYRPPETIVPLEWKTPQKVQPSTSKVENWWEIFNDMILNQLEQCALENSPNLAIAFSKVVESRAKSLIRKSELYPKVTLDPEYLNTGTLFQVFGLPPAPAGTKKFPTIIRVHELIYNLLFNFNYEVDLWGKLRSKYKSSFLNLKAEEMAFQTTLLMLTTDLASHYFQLRSFDSQIKVLKETLAKRQDTLNINEERYKGGLINFTDVTRSRTLVFNAEKELYDVTRRRALEENMIASLIGVPPSMLHIAYSPLLIPPPMIPAGLPSSILLRRPDIVEAERRAAAEHALIGAARAEFFPSLKLTGSLGFASPDFKDFLTWKSREWSFGFDSSETIFDGMRNSSNLELAWARFNQASASYQKTVITAFQEVENSLINLELEAKEIESLKNSIAATQDTTELSRTRYFKGLIDYLDVVDSERTQLELERNLMILIGQRYVSTVELIKALGGCWDVEELPKRNECSQPLIPEVT